MWLLVYFSFMGGQPEVVDEYRSEWLCNRAIQVTPTYNGELKCLPALEE